MMKSLNKFRDLHQDIKIIIGMDANQCLFSSKRNFFYTVPNLEAKTTSTKKRTSMQVQFHKTDVEVCEIKDHLMSTQPILVEQVIKNFESGSKRSVFMINGSDKVEEVYLPNSDHPYDHFVVSGFI